MSTQNDNHMRFREFEANHAERNFRIVEDRPEVGSYLYVYEGGECISDFLQNDIESCMQMALEDYKVPIESWVEIKG